MASPIISAACTSTTLPFSRVPSVKEAPGSLVVRRVYSSTSPISTSPSSWFQVVRSPSTRSTGWVVSSTSSWRQESLGREVSFRVCDERVETPAKVHRCASSLLATLTSSSTALPIRRNAEGEIPIASAFSAASFRLLANFVTSDLESAKIFDEFGSAVLASNDARVALASLRHDAEYFLASTTNDADFADFTQALQNFAAKYGVSAGELLCPAGVTWAVHSVLRPNVSKLHSVPAATVVRANPECKVCSKGVLHSAQEAPRKIQIVSPVLPLNVNSRRSVEMSNPPRSGPVEPPSPSFIAAIAASRANAGTTAPFGQSQVKVAVAASLPAHKFYHTLPLQCGAACHVGNHYVSTEGAVAQGRTNACLPLSQSPLLPFPATANQSAAALASTSVTDAVTPLGLSAVVPVDRTPVTSPNIAHITSPVHSRGLVMPLPNASPMGGGRSAVGGMPPTSPSAVMHTQPAARRFSFGLPVVHMQSRDVQVSNNN